LRGVVVVGNLVALRRTVTGHLSTAAARHVFVHGRDGAGILLGDVADGSAFYG
jgi:hypothetical protein